MTTKKFFIYTACLLAMIAMLPSYRNSPESKLQGTVTAKSALIKTIGNYTFRDLNKNGKLDIYEDARQPVELRIKDLLKQMTIEEKAGMMFYSPVRVNKDGTIEEKPAKDLLSSISPVGINEIDKHKITHFNLFSVPAPDTLAIWYNRMQQFEEKTRLGIPLTIASDPRNQGTGGFFSKSAKTFSLWPDPLGLAAIGDEKITGQFADISRQEYLAVGIRQALHPQVDLATEPSWPRISGTFGEDAALSSRMTIAYIKGYQGEKVGPNSVAMMTKHFPGGGPQKEGLDPHFEFQKGVNDALRTAFIQKHINAVHEAIQKGVKIKGYYV